MFNSSRKTLRTSLHTLLDNAPDYLADVCFQFPEAKVWAHRAILLARVPKSFQSRISLTDKTTTIDISSLVPYPTFLLLMRFWYTSELYPVATSSSSALSAPLSVVGSPIANASAFSTTTTKSSVSSTVSTSPDDSACTKDQVQPPVVLTRREEIQCLEKQLGCDLLTQITDNNKSDFDQLTYDLQRMRTEQLACDVSVRILLTPPPQHPPKQQKQQLAIEKSLPSSPTTVNGKAIPSILFAQAPDTNTEDDSVPVTVTTSGDDDDVEESFPAHRFMLAAQSSYFYALFCTQFSESSSSTVHLPADLFSPTVAEVILGYLYTDTLIIPPLPKSNALSAIQQRLALKKYSLRILQQVFPAADYLGHFDTVCEAVMHEMGSICHNFKCLCSDCAVLLPSMLWFGDKNVAAVPSLRPALVELYSEPVHSIAPLWSQQTFAVLVGTLRISEERRAEYALSALFNHLDGDDEPSMLVEDIRQRTLTNVTKHNAIQVLQSLHICLSKIRCANPFPTWSTPVLDLLDPILKHTVEMVATNFDFYCVEYPILLSCVDGIGVGFSVDFLEFLLNRVLSESMHYSNAGILYQGIVRDLVGRQEMVKNVAVDSVLIDARKRCAEYIARHWYKIKAQNGFSKVEKDIMRRMSEDTGVPYRNLSKISFDSDFATMFGFKSRSNKYKYKFLSDDTSNSRSNKDNRTRRLSLGSLRPQRSNGTLKGHDDTAQLTRTRSLSNDITISRPTIPDTLSAENISKLSEKALSSQPLVQLLSIESEARRQKQEVARNGDKHSNPIRSFPLPSSLADALLPLDFLPLLSAQQQQKKEESKTPIARPSRLTFELPIAPLRAKSPVQKPFLAPTAAPNEHAHGSSSGGRRRHRGGPPRRPRWGIGSNSSDVSDDEELVTMVVPVIGAKVELLRRPLPTLGTIKFVGNVNFAKGIWVGVELESRLGKSDGEVEGVRYFRTDPQRGVFVKVDDFKVISLPNDGSALTI